MSGTQGIVDRSRRRNGCLGIGCGTVFGGCGLAFVSAVVAAMISDPNPAGLFLLGIGSVFALAGGAAFVYGARSIWLSHVLGVPMLTVSPAEPLCLGGVVVARFHRSGGSRQVRATPRLTAELICQESATYRQGTDDHTVTREVHRLDPGRRRAGDRRPDRGAARLDRAAAWATRWMTPTGAAGCRRTRSRMAARTTT